MPLHRRAPHVPPADADAAEAWYTALKTSSPEDANRAFWQAVDVVCDVAGAERDAVAAAMESAEGSALRAWFEGWFCYGLHLVCSGIHGPGTVGGRPVRRSSLAGL